MNDDLRELIESFQSHGVEFMVVGAHALAFYAFPRFTEDLDLFVRRTRENAARIRLALTQMGFEVSAEAEAQLADLPRGMIVLGNKPSEVDILNFLDGVDFEGAWSRRESGQIAGLHVPFIGLEDYLASKRATGRPKDIDDINRLREFLGGRLPDEI